MLPNAGEPLDEKGQTKLLGLLNAGDPTAKSASPGTPKRWFARSSNLSTPGQWRRNPSPRAPSSVPVLPTRDPPDSDAPSAIVPLDRHIVPSPCLQQPNRSVQQPHQENQTSGFRPRRFADFGVRSLISAGYPARDFRPTVRPIEIRRATKLASRPRPTTSRASLYSAGFKSLATILAKISSNLARTASCPLRRSIASPLSEYRFPALASPTAAVIASTRDRSDSPRRKIPA